MFPILIRFPDWMPLIAGKSIHTYGAMIALGFLLGMIYVRRESRRVNVDENVMMDLFFWVMVSGLGGSRLFYIINSVDHFWRDPLVFFRVWEGGLVFQGGILLAGPTVWWFVRRHKLDFWKVADIYTPPLALGHALGRLGCFFAGCCFGKQCPRDFPLGIIFPANPDTVAPVGVPLYPTQLGESFGEFIIFTALLLYRRKKPFDGAVFLVYLVIYSILRSYVEIYRGDTIRGFIIEPYLSNGQFVSVCMVLFCIFAWTYLSKKAKKA